MCKLFDKKTGELMCRLSSGQLALILKMLGSVDVLAWFVLVDQDDDPFLGIDRWSTRPSVA